MSRRQRHRSAGSHKLEFFYIYNEFVRLWPRVELFRSETSLLLESVSEEEPLAMRVEGTVDHYNVMFDLL